MGITLKGASVQAVSEEVAAKIREELADIEEQRKQWELDQLTKQADQAKKAKKMILLQTEEAQAILAPRRPTTHPPQIRPPQSHRQPPTGSPWSSTAKKPP